MSNQQFPFLFVPAGKVTSFSGAGVSASFETKEQEAKGELAQLTLKHAQRGIEFGNSATLGPVQSPNPRERNL